MFPIKSCSGRAKFKKNKQSNDHFSLSKHRDQPHVSIAASPPPTPCPSLRALAKGWAVPKCLHTVAVTCLFGLSSLQWIVERLHNTQTGLHNPPSTLQNTYTPSFACSWGLHVSFLSVPKSERTTVHKNLIFALAAAEALLMFSELAKTNQVSSLKQTLFTLQDQSCWGVIGRANRSLIPSINSSLTTCNVHIGKNCDSAFATCNLSGKFTSCFLPEKPSGNISNCRTAMYELLFPSWMHILRIFQRTFLHEGRCDFCSLQVLCFLVTAFLHLSFMAAFSWMLVEGLLLWSKVVAVNMSEDRRMKFYYATGWGISRFLCTADSGKNASIIFYSKSFNRRNSPRSGAVRPMLGLVQYESLLSLLCRGFLTLM